MFKNMLAKVGFGSADVDLVVLSEELVPGYPFEVRINIKGGKVSQEVNGIVLNLMTSSEFEVEAFDGDDYAGVEQQVLTQWEVELNTVIEPNQNFSTVIELVLHPETPITAIEGVPNYSRVWIDTELDIEDGLDSSDRDYLSILPTPTQAAALNAMIESGYYLKKIDVESGSCNHADVVSEFNCYQEFEFGLGNGGFFGIQEVEMTFINNGEITGLVLEIDRAFGNDTYRQLTLDNDIDTLDDIVPALQEVLSDIY